jgi:pimeloyl-ACP methyl ester carboxylesterase
MTDWLLTVDGAGYSGFIPSAMRGTLAKRRRVKPVPYPNSYFDSSTLTFVNAVQAVAIGKRNLRDTLRALPKGDTATLAGVSMGTQVITSLLRDPDAVDGLDLSRLSCVLLASPEHPETGWSRVPKPSLGKPPNMGGVGLPADCEVPTTWFTRQWDGVADQPNVERPGPDAVWNAVCGLFVHMNYFTVTLEDKSNVWLTDPDNPRVRYGWAPTATPPALGVNRASVERSYRRPKRPGKDDRW